MNRGLAARICGLKDGPAGGREALVLTSGPSPHNDGRRDGNWQRAHAVKVAPDGGKVEGGGVRRELSAVRR